MQNSTQSAEPQDLLKTQDPTVQQPPLPLITLKLVSAAQLLFQSWGKVTNEFTPAGLTNFNFESMQQL